jgi:hypothetical protein
VGNKKGRFLMKVMQIGRLRSSDHAEMREGLANFEKHGAPGMEALWLSADARTLVALYELDDPSELHKYQTLYAPYLESVETHLMSDAAAGTANMRAGLDLAT